MFWNSSSFETPDTDSWASWLKEIFPIPKRFQMGLNDYPLGICGQFLDLAYAARVVPWPRIDPQCLLLVKTFIAEI